MTKDEGASKKKPGKKKAASSPKKPKGKKTPAAEKKPAKAARAKPDDEEDEEPEPKEPAKRTGRSLVVVESPAKAKTINKYLGKSYVVKASMGHVRDLPAKGLAVDIDHDFEAPYEILESKKKVVQELKDAAKDAPAIYLACDMDREGEAIAWHVSEILRAKKRAHRVTFNEITKTAIERAFEHPRDLDMAKVEAQHARRILDRIVGYKLSPLLWEKTGNRSLSAGRVQSVAVKLVVEKEREIKAFKPIEYWQLEALLAKKDAPPAPPPPPPPPEAKDGKEGEPGEKTAEPRVLGPGRFFAKLERLGEEKVDVEGKARITNEAEAQALKKELEGAAFAVSSIKTQERKDNPSPPFITSTLQQQASTRLRFSTKKTMMIAQQLYEGVELGDEGSVGLITYMRTDSFNLAEEAVTEARDFIKETFGEKYLPEAPRVYKRDAKAGAQEAHEAVRPTSARRTPESVERFLSPEQQKLYRLIWERFVACQMPPGVFLQTTVDVGAGRATFRANGRTMIFDGHLRVSGTSKKEGEADLPRLSEQEALDLEKLQESQHFTQPPPRYTEASLVKELEEKGIGRPSTYAAIISTIQDKGYVEQQNRRLFATELGTIVTGMLDGHFKKVMDYDFTRDMETRLDKIEEERVPWVKVMQDFWEPFERDLETASALMKGLNEEPQVSDTSCPKCGKKMVFKYNTRTFERFLGCPGYPECKETMPVSKEGEVQHPEETDENCPECGSSMQIRTGRRGRFLACSAYPSCKVTREVADDGKAELMPELEAVCDLCGKKMVVRRGRRGPFLGCTGYPDCKSTRPIVLGPDGRAMIGEKREQQDMPKIDVKCEKCGKPMAIRRSRRGPFLGCTGYPKCKGTAQVPEGIDIPKPPPPQPLGENCENCGKPLVIRYGRRGPFAACSGYPQCKTTKPLPAGA